jgi:chromosome segregation ATPase
MLKVNETTKHLISTMQTQYTSKIKNLEDILKKNNIELKELKIELGEKNRQIAQHESGIQCLEKTVSQLQQCVEEKNGQIAQQEEHEHEHERCEHIRQKMLQLQQCVEEKSGQIAQHESGIQRLEQTVSQLQQCVEEKNGQIAQHEERCEHIRQKMLELQQCVEEKNGQIAQHEMKNNKLNKKIEDLKNETNEKMQSKKMLYDKIQELTNELENKTKLIEEINKIVLKNNLFFEQTNMELSSNKIKIEELKTLYDNVKEALRLKHDELMRTKEELELATNNFIIKQTRNK